MYLDKYLQEINTEEAYSEDYLLEGFEDIKNIGKEKLKNSLMKIKKGIASKDLNLLKRVASATGIRPPKSADDLKNSLLKYNKDAKKSYDMAEKVLTNTFSNIDKNLLKVAAGVAVFKSVVKSMKKKDNVNLEAETRENLKDIVYRFRDELEEEKIGSDEEKSNKKRPEGIMTEIIFGWIILTVAAIILGYIGFNVSYFIVTWFTYGWLYLLIMFVIFYLLQKQKEV